MKYSAFIETEIEASSGLDALNMLSQQLLRGGIIAKKVALDTQYDPAIELTFLSGTYKCPSCSQPLTYEDYRRGVCHACTTVIFRR